MEEKRTKISETMEKIVRSRTCGCKDLYVAIVLQNTATQYMAGTPRKLSRLVKAKIDEKWSSEKVFSDDETEEVITAYEGTDVELEVNALAPQDMAFIFGHK